VVVVVVGGLQVQAQSENCVPHLRAPEKLSLTAQRATAADVGKNFYNLHCHTLARIDFQQRDALAFPTCFSQPQKGVPNVMKTNDMHISDT